MKDNGENGVRFVPAVCPKCGAELQVDAEQEEAYCQYCGTKFVVEKAVNKYIAQSNTYNTTVNETNNIKIGKKGIIESIADYKEDKEKREEEEERRQKEENWQRIRAVFSFIGIHWKIFLSLAAGAILAAGMLSAVRVSCSTYNGLVYILTWAGFITIVYLILYDKNKTLGFVNKNWKLLLPAVFICVIVVVIANHIRSPYRVRIVSVPVSSEGAKGKDYSDVSAQFYEAGFTDVQIKDTEDIDSKDTKDDDKIISVTIDDEKTFDKGQKYRSNAAVVINYHNIPEIHPPVSSYDLEDNGYSYEVLEGQFRDAGFTNVVTEPVSDLVLGIMAKSGEIEQVSINGNSSFNSSDLYNPDAKVVIYYHAFAESTEDTLSTGSGTQDIDITTAPAGSGSETASPASTEAAEESIDISGQKKQKDAYDTAQKTEYTTGMMSFAIPDYWIEDKTGSNDSMSFRAETGEKAAIISITSKEDKEYSVNYFNLLEKKDSIMSSYMESEAAAGSYDKLHENEINNDSMNGILYSLRYDITVNGNDSPATGYLLIFPSDDESKWYYVSLMQTDNTDYAYDHDFLKIIRDIKGIQYKWDKPATYDEAFVNSTRAYYLIDTKRKEAVFFTENTFPVVEKYTGDLSKGADAFYKEADFHEILQISGSGYTSELTVYDTDDDLSDNYRGVDVTDTVNKLIQTVKTEQ